MYKLKTNLKFSSCSIFFKKNTKDSICNHLEKIKYDKAFIITNNLIYKLHSNHEIFNQGYELIVLNDNQKNKNLKKTEETINQLVSKGCNRGSLIIGVGGGSITDLTGFIASIFMRGIQHIFLPTTLLGMVDASIGGKTGVNTLSGKNLIGTFKQPNPVFIDLSFLNTLTKEQVIDGFSEIIKYGLICDFDLYNKIKNNFTNLVNFKNKNLIYDIILKSIKHKINIVTKDELDYNQRMILNFGHTIGHGLENYYNYQNITHGDAVYYGMISASFISFKLKYLTNNDFEDITDFIYKIPKFKIHNVDIDKLYNCLTYDKKNINNINHFIILNKIGHAIIKNNIPKDIIFESMNFIINRKK